MLGLNATEAASFYEALRAATALLGEERNVADWHVHHFSFTLQGINALKETLHGLDHLLLVPKLPTWSRLPALNARGPRPMRSRRFPWGMPWVHGGISSRLDDENVLIQMAFECMGSFLRAGSGIDTPRWLALASPEDLGPVGDDAPPSLWQLNELHELAESFKLHRSAFCQCRLEPSKHARPTGILTSHPPPTGVCKRGWPKITTKYLGPLPRACGCGRRHVTMQRIKRNFNPPEGMLETGSLKLLAASLLSFCSSTISATDQGLPRTGVLLEALLPRARLYEIDEDDYDTDATVLLDPPECDVATRQLQEAQGCAELQQLVAYVTLDVCNYPSVFLSATQQMINTGIAGSEAYSAGRCSPGALGGAHACQERLGRPQAIGAPLPQGSPPTSAASP